MCIPTAFIDLVCILPAEETKPRGKEFYRHLYGAP